MRVSHIFAFAVVLAASSSIARADDAKGAPSPAPKEEVAVAAALKRTDDTKVKTVDESAAPASDGTSPVVGGHGEAIVHEGSSGLASVHVETVRTSTTVAGKGREITMPTAPTKHVSHLSRPPASPRLLRRMNVDLVVQTLSPAFAVCVASTPAPKGGPGSVVIATDITPRGAVETTEVMSTGGLPEEALGCLEQQIRAATFGAPGAGGAEVFVRVKLAGATSS